MNKPAFPQGKSIPVNGLDLYYLDWGNGNRQALLLLHGFLSHSHIWSSFAGHMCSDYHVIALDHRGHGRSGWPDDGAYGIDDHMVDLAGFTGYLGLNETILVGHSMGGRNALFFAACCPEKIRGLILVDARPANTADSTLALKNMVDQVKRATKLNIGVDHEKPFQEPGIDRLFDPRLIIGAESARYRVESLWPFMESLACPTLIIRGETSAFLSRKEADRMCQLIPHSELVEIPGTSHLPMLEQPVAFRTAVNAFLKKYGGPVSGDCFLSKA